MATRIETKYISRPEWKRIEERDFCWHEVSQGEFIGVAALLRLKKVRNVLRVSSCGGKQITIVDNGYFWLQLAPEGQHWWLTAMFDQEGHAVQYYFDVTRQNHICDEESHFDDLMLDVILTPYEPPMLLDEDELKEALRIGSITKADYDLAATQAQALLKGLTSRRQELAAFCSEQLERLQLLLP